jgi:hypothetical protein
VIYVYFWFVFSNKVTALCYAGLKQQLISGGEDSVLVFWDMTLERKEVRYIHTYRARNKVGQKWSLTFVSVKWSPNSGA